MIKLLLIEITITSINNEQNGKDHLQGWIQTTASTAGAEVKFSDPCFYAKKILTNRQFT